MITQHQGKLKIKEIEEFSEQGTVLFNFVYTYEKLSDLYHRLLQSQLRVHGEDIVKHLGNPNCNMRGYESYPGAWVFYDDEYDVRWIVFSDGIRKGCYKGTSYELTIPENMPEDSFIQAVINFFDFMTQGASY